MRSWGVLRATLNFARAVFWPRSVACILFNISGSEKVGPPVRFAEFYCDLLIYSDCGYHVWRKYLDGESIAFGAMWVLESRRWFWVFMVWKFEKAIYRRDTNFCVNILPVPSTHFLNSEWVSFPRWHHLYFHTRFFRGLSTDFPKECKLSRDSQRVT